MDTFLAIAGERDWRRYADRRIPDDVVTPLLNAAAAAPKRPIDIEAGSAAEWSRSATRNSLVDILERR